MQIYNADGSTLMQVTSLDRRGNNLIINGTIMEAMPVRCILTPSQARSGLKLLRFRLLAFLLTFLLRS